MDRLWTSSFFKSPVAGPVYVGKTNIAGDAQADLVHHGGVDKAILAYSADHYPQWHEELQISDLPYGAFGENLSIAGLAEDGVCIGDVWEMGDVRVEVSQPRQPCWKLARHWRIKNLAAQVEQNGRTGWYFRVLAEGTIAAGQPIVLRQRRHPEWTVARANDLMHRRKHDRVLAAELAGLPELSASWQKTLRQRAEEGREPDVRLRREGP